MSQGPALIPVVLFAYARPAHLARVLACLRENAVPLIYAFSDGAKGPEDAAKVAEVRALLRDVAWCDLRLTERPENLGLGRNVLAGVDEVAAKHEAFVVWEDDLICVPGTYDWMRAALRHYATDPRVMSVSAWTHPRVTPADVGDWPYFDARADCWVWGAWSRSWTGMNQESAMDKMRSAARRGVAADAHGADLPMQAAREKRRNVWAVRWLYHHLQSGGLCLRPPWSMVEHIGFDAGATNAGGAEEWQNPPLRKAPRQPDVWPSPEVHPGCQALWRAAYPPTGLVTRLGRRAQGGLRRLFRTVTPLSLRTSLRAIFGWRWFRGDYRTWVEARAVSGGYDDRAILRKVLAATLEVKAGRAAFERDSVLFAQPEPDVALLGILQSIAANSAGRLRVLDFGGSLGSTYWRHRFQLPSGENLRWDVVEQPDYVEAGRRHLADTPLGFYHDVSSAQAAGPHDVLLCSCALQYLDEPFRCLAQWSRLGIPCLLLNNLPLHDHGPDRLCVQHVPPSIYAASYPVWFFNRADFRRRVAAHYEIVKEFDAEARWPVGWGMLQSTGMLLKRRADA
ncbi:methyltransferase, TIGR04325 family [Oleiharenicola lentus]|uniref:Methyltransferase, TIGR04325 family n=1 Tax=Oleiharenicola lentus TaxID=2508720 RepID=A0A4Q1C582_9BACT|nr:methyltransferase, TIGR04325 family [Oleiharenicola lentus]RXK53449.1 methyltransferase, TIGR04325 family [Oleiharenicola lentus]